MSATLSHCPLIGKWQSTTVREVYDSFRTVTSRSLVAVIKTRYESPTDTKGSCFRAVDLQTNDISFVGFDYTLTTPENHLAAAMELIKDWRVADYQLASWSVDHTGHGYLFTFVAA